MFAGRRYAGPMLSAALIPLAFIAVVMVTVYRERRAFTYGGVLYGGGG